MTQHPLVFDQATNGPLDQPPDLTGVKRVYVDFETTGLDWRRGDRPVGLALGDGQQAWYLPFAHRGGDNLDEGAIKRYVRDQIRGKELVCHNAPFECHMSRVWGSDYLAQGNSLIDVQHPAALLEDHRKRFALDILGQDFLGQGKVQAPINRAHLAALPGSAVAAYARGDVNLPAALMAVFEPRMAQEDLLRVFKLECDTIAVVVEMEQNGLPLDMDALERWAAEARVLEDRLAREVVSLAGFALNPASATHMARLFRQCGLEGQWGTTPTGQPSFTAEIVRRAAALHPTIARVWRLAKVQDLRQKAFTPFLEHQINGVLYPAYHQLKSDDDGSDKGATSGRFSSSKPNSQQLMGADKFARLYGFLSEYTSESWLVRRLVKPEQGDWVCADQKQVEPRLAVSYASLLQDPDAPAWIERYRENPEISFHTIVGEMIRRASPDFKRSHTEVKIGGLQLLYGGTKNSLSRTLGMSEEDAVKFVADYERGFPMLRRILYRATSVANQRGFVCTRLGRRCRFPGTPGRRERTHKALNAVVQGTAADILKMTLVKVHKASKDLGLTLRAAVHDEIDGDLVGGPPALARFNEFLHEPVIDLPVPLLWDSKIGASWGEAK